MTEFETKIAEIRELLAETEALITDIRVEAFSIRMDVAEMNAALDGKTLGDE